jgi:hypothetical protein
MLLVLQQQLMLAAHQLYLQVMVLYPAMDVTVLKQEPGQQEMLVVTLRLLPAQ